MSDSSSATVTDTASGLAPSASSPRWMAALGAPLAGFGLAVTLVIWFLGGAWWLAAIVGILVAVAVAAALYLRADAIVARRLGAVSVASVHPRLSNMVEELSVRAGVREPDLFMSSSDEINAAAFGRNALAQSLVVTNGAINRLDVVELEGLLAREIGRIRTGASRVETLGAVFTRGPLAPLAGIGTKLVNWARGGDRVMADDMEGARICRYPPGLARSLQLINEGSNTSGSRSVDHLWAAGPRGLSGAPGEWTLDSRIELLNEL